MASFNDNDGGGGGYVEPTQKCPHVFSSSVDVDGWMTDDALGPTFKEPCEICQDLTENWICLSCRMPICSRFVQGHAEEHWIDTMMYSGGTEQHCLVLSISDLSVWCYACSTYVKHDCLLPMLVRAESLKFNEPENVARLANCRKMFDVGVSMHSISSSAVADNGDVDTVEDMMHGVQTRLAEACLMSQLVHVMDDMVSCNGSNSDATLLIRKLLRHEGVPSAANALLTKGISLIQSDTDADPHEALIAQVITPAMTVDKSTAADGTSSSSGSTTRAGVGAGCVLVIKYGHGGVVCGGVVLQTTGDGSSVTTVDATHATSSAKKTEGEGEGGGEEQVDLRLLMSTHATALVVVSFPPLAEGGWPGAPEGGCAGGARQALVGGGSGRATGGLPGAVARVVRTVLDAANAGSGGGSDRASSSSSASASASSSASSSAVPVLVCFTLDGKSRSNSRHISKVSAAVECAVQELLA